MSPVQSQSGVKVKSSTDGEPEPNASIQLVGSSIRKELLVIVPEANLGKPLSASEYCKVITTPSGTSP